MTVPAGFGGFQNHAKPPPSVGNEQMSPQCHIAMTVTTDFKCCSGISAQHFCQPALAVNNCRKLWQCHDRQQREKMLQ
jgi:hypothetical protein